MYNMQTLERHLLQLKDVLRWKCLQLVQEKIFAKSMMNKSIGEAYPEVPDIPIEDDSDEIEVKTKSLSD